MKKGKIVLIIVILVLVGGAAFGVYYLSSNDLNIFKSEAEVEAEQNKKLEKDEEEGVFDRAIEEYTEVSGVRAEGTATYTMGTKTYEGEIEAKSNGIKTHYLKATIDNETLYVYTKPKDDADYVYVSDGKDTVRFKMVEDSKSEEHYEDLSETDPTNMVEDLNDWEKDPDIELEYQGVEDCRDMKCHKYLVTDNSTTPPTVTTIYLDTKERLPRIIEVDSTDLDGKFDIYYDKTDFKVPEDYEDINVETWIGLQKLYRVVGDFADLFL